MKSVTIVGASLAGLQSARALRDQGFDGELTIVGEEAHRPYDRPPLSKEFLAGTVSATDLSLEDDSDLGAQWALGTAAVALNPADTAVILGDGSRIKSDGVVIATGARARYLPGIAPGSGVHVLRTLDQATALRAELQPGARVVIVGAGFIGSEVASTASTLGCDVTLVEAASTPLSGPLGATMASVVVGLHQHHGVRLHCGAAIDQVIIRDRVEAVILAGGTRIEADVVVVGVGADANTEWLTGSGVAVGNGVLCDAHGRTSMPGVVAVGDCASWSDPIRGAHRTEHWTSALERPAVAVGALLAGTGPIDDPPRRPPYFWSDQYGTRIQFAGYAADADSVTIEAGSLEGLDVLAVYRRRDVPVAVLGMNQPRLFGRLRRQLITTPIPA